MSDSTVVMQTFYVPRWWWKMPTFRWLRFICLVRWRLRGPGQFIPTPTDRREPDDRRTPSLTYRRISRVRQKIVFKTGGRLTRLAIQEAC